MIASRAWIALVALVGVVCASPAHSHAVVALKARTNDAAAAAAAAAAQPPPSDPVVLVRGEAVVAEAAAATNATNAKNATQTVVVQQGDTLTALGAKFGVGICDIAKASNLANPNVITPGQELTIPPPTSTPDDRSCLPPPAPPATATCVLGGPDRLVIPPDGLTAERAAGFLNITAAAFAAANADVVRAGSNASAELAANSVVRVPVCPHSQCTISQGTVKQGDVFDAIAAAAGSTTGQILALNPGIDRLNLAVGQTFTLPSNCQNATGAAGDAGKAGNATEAGGNANKTAAGV